MFVDVGGLPVRGSLPAARPPHLHKEIRRLMETVNQPTSGADQTSCSSTSKCGVLALKKDTSTSGPTDPYHSSTSTPELHTSPELPWPDPTPTGWWSLPHSPRPRDSDGKPTKGNRGPRNRYPISPTPPHPFVRLPDPVPTGPVTSPRGESHTFLPLVSPGRTRVPLPRLPVPTLVVLQRGTPV